MKTKKSRLLPLLLWLGLFALIGLVAYQAYRRNAPPPVSQTIRTDKVTRGPLTITVSATGTLNPVKVVNVGTQVSGTVRKLYVDFNDRVEAGQVLLEIDTDQLDAQARSSSAQIARQNAAVKLSRVKAQRYRDLFAKEFVSRQELDQVESELAQGEAQLAQARAEDERVRANLANAIIRSPVSGVVLDRVVDVGQTVAASFQTPTLIKIAQDLSTMQINASFAEADLGRVRAGLPAQFSVDAFPDRRFRGKVRQLRLNPTVQQNVVTYDVVIDVDNADQVLLPGMTAYVNLVLDRRDDALTVPNSALRFRPPEEKDKDKVKEGKEEKRVTGNEAKPDAPAATDGASGRGQRGEGRGERRRQRGGEAGTAAVYVLEGETLRRVEIKTGVSDNRRTEVLAGELKPDDLVAIGTVAKEGDAAASSNRGGPMGMRRF